MTYLVSDDSSVLELSYSSEYIKDKINNFNPDFNINEIKFKNISKIVSYVRKFVIFMKKFYLKIFF